MKQHEWVTPNRMKFESEHKTFNRQVDCISSGNVIGRVQLSGFVRPYKEVECNGRVNPKGHLQEYDLGWLLKDFPCYVKDYIRKHGKDKSLIGYEFRYWRGNRKHVCGYVVTTGDEKLMKYWFFNGKKSLSVIHEAIKYISTGRFSSGKYVPWEKEVST